MNLREGTRRLAMLLGVVGALLGGFASYMQLQTVMRQREDHARFEQLANSDVVQQARAALYAVGPKHDPPLPAGATILTPCDVYAVGEKAYKKFDCYTSTVREGGITAIAWNTGYEVYSIETTDGQTLYPTPAPRAWSYALIAILPVFGFFIPWGAVRAIGWVGAGFFQPSK